MKKLFTLAIAAATLLTASAADFDVYKNGEICNDIVYYGWWNCAFNAQADLNGETVMSLTDENKTGDAMSCGLATKTDCGKLHNATLNFSYYCATPMNIDIRLTVNGGKEQDYRITVAEGEAAWKTLSLSVEENWPEVAALWNENAGKGDGYVFGVSVSGIQDPANAVVYFKDVYYSNIDEAWKAPEVAVAPDPTTVPVPTQEAADVMSLLCGKYTAATPFNIAWWGQSTVVTDVTIDGAPVEKFTNFNYQGWELTQHIDVSAMQYVHVDYYPTEPVENPTFGFTIISPGQEKAYVASNVKAGEWNSCDVPLSFWSNVDLKDIFQMKFDNGNLGTGYLANVYFYKDENGGGSGEDPKEPVTGDSAFEGTTSGSFSQTMNEETKDYPVTLDYLITYNEDNTLTIKLTADWREGEPVGLVKQVHINGDYFEMASDGDVYTYTTTKTYEEGSTVNIFAWMPYALGAGRLDLVTDGVLKHDQGTSVINLTVADEEAEYYTLQGVKAANPSNGIYVKVVNGKASKVLVK